MKYDFDHKRAASGEREEDAPVALEPVESLRRAMNRGRTTIATADLLEAPRRALNEYELYHPPMRELLSLCDYKPDQYWHPLLQDDHEIVIEYAKATTSWKAPMTLDQVSFQDLVREPFELPIFQQVAERKHPLVYQTTICRGDLKDQSSIIEIGVYSRKISTGQKFYMGKAKLYFPRPYWSMLFYIEFSKLQ